MQKEIMRVCKQILHGTLNVLYISHLKTKIYYIASKNQTSTRQELYIDEIK